MKKVCFITPGHISSNPRLVKEAICLSNLGYQVHVIFVQNLLFLIKEDEHVLNGNPTWTYGIINNATNRYRLSYLFNAIGNKLALLTFKSNIFSKYYNLALNQNFYRQLKQAFDCKADLYIAHNLAALPIAVNAAKKNNTKCGFDAEDFHRQEVSDDIHSYPYQLARFIEDKYFPKLAYISYASPLIAKAYERIYPNLNSITINNVFSKNFLQKLNPSVSNRPLKLFWFSQTIGKGRGLEDVILAINQLKELAIELNLLGNISVVDQCYFDSLSNFNINYIAPIAGDDIFKLANNFDIGLALELNVPFNRDLCLTNKIFTYLQAGLAFIASATAAQKKFFAENPKIGYSYPIGDVASLVAIIKTYDLDRELLNSTKQNALQLAEIKYNWEVESKKFLKIVEETLAS